MVLESIEVVDAGQGGSSLELYGDAWTAADPAAGDGSATAGEPMFGRDRNHAVTIAEGHTWPQTGSVAEKVVDVVPQAGHVVDAGAVLHDCDDGLFSSDHSIGDESLEAPFETGWHRTMTVHITGAGSQVQLTFSLEPILTASRRARRPRTRAPAHLPVRAGQRYSRSHMARIRLPLQSAWPASARASGWLSFFSCRSSCRRSRCRGRRRAPGILVTMVVVLASIAITADSLALDVPGAIALPTRSARAGSPWRAAP